MPLFKVLIDNEGEPESKTWLNSNFGRVFGDTHLFDRPKIVCSCND